MLNAMYVRHIIFRFSLISLRNDQLNFSFFSDERLMRSRWLVEWRWSERLLKQKESKTNRKAVSVDVKSRSLISNWEFCWKSCWSIRMHSSFKHFVLVIFNFFNILLSLHNSIRSNNNLWKCFWHDLTLYAS